jgi:hypothetical protein
VDGDVLDLLNRCEEGGFHALEPELRYLVAKYLPLGLISCVKL